ncbi:MAG TPA: hypothetical protein VH459_10600 [Gaiellales bacterium]|jgi:hypothetical protein
MLFLIFGSSAAGKTFVLEPLRRRVPDVVAHDFDEIGVPAAADLEWRLRSNEEWLQTALEHQRAGRDMLLAGNTPIGELVDSPSAPLIEGISACLLDCDDATRTERLRVRGEAWIERTGADLDDYLAWADLLRRHAADPRWNVHTIDTSRLSVDEVADELARWIRAQRRPADAAPGT